MSILEQIEKALHIAIPDNWTSEDIDDLIGKTQYIRDIEALNKSFREPMHEIIFRGGKRLRPTLFALLLEGFNINPSPYFNIAVGLEIIHNGTLVVDDIEDDSVLRRGKPTIHKIYDLDIAVNAGMAMHFLPLIKLINHSKIDSQQRLRLFEIYSQEIVSIYIGQSTDIYWHKDFSEHITPDMYFEMCRLKTGALMRMSVRYACVIAKQNKKTEEAFTSFAESIGVAFQIMDDILDLKATAKEFGKAYGNDITEGKISLPVILALAELAPDKQKRVWDILRMHTDNKKVIQEFQQIITTTNAIPKATEYAEELITEAWTSISNKILNTSKKEKLHKFINSFINREY